MNVRDGRIVRQVGVEAWDESRRGGSSTGWCGAEA